MRLVLHPAALAEFVEAAGFYQAQATGLGLDFFREVERILRILEDNPEVATLRSLGVRSQDFDTD